MSAPLNPALYAALTREFGRVRVSFPGEAMVAAPARDPATGEPRLAIRQQGETYLVCCPFCGDRRHRLYVSHLYDRRYPGLERSLAFLAHCFNADCLRDPLKRELFRDRATALGRTAAGPLGVGRVVPEELRAPGPPGPVLPVHELPAGHPAVAYLRGRGFDPGRVGRAFGVGYCPQSRFPLAGRRLIAPVTADGKLVGWQARYVGELPWAAAAGRSLPPKYFTMPGLKKGQHLYNLDRAARGPLVVVTEGVTDVWAAGPQAVAAFGCHLGDAQADRLRARLRADAAVVLLFDPDAFVAKPGQDVAAAAAAEARLRARFGGRLAVVRLPAGTDPGATDRAVLRQTITAQAREQGVRADWRVSE